MTYDDVRAVILYMYAELAKATRLTPRREDRSALLPAGGRASLRFLFCRFAFTWRRRDDARIMRETTSSFYGMDIIFTGPSSKLTYSTDWLLRGFEEFSGVASAYCKLVKSSLSFRRWPTRGIVVGGCFITEGSKCPTAVTLNESIVFRAK